MIYLSLNYLNTFLSFSASSCNFWGFCLASFFRLKSFHCFSLVNQSWSKRLMDGSVTTK